MKSKLNLQFLKPEYLRQLLDRYKYPVLVCLVGLLLLSWPKGREPETKTADQTSQQQENYTAALETEMERLFVQMKGVGRVKVMLTIKSSKEVVYAYDTDSSVNRQENSMTQSSKTELITVGTGNGETPIITQTLMPQYMGAVVVCEGADSPSVCLQLTEAVRSLTGITSDNIVISKMQN